MNRLLRILMMFGPMIYKQYQKYQRNKASKQHAQNVDKQIDPEH